tara:strand:+ start:2224 stop:2517 length:294 start_codon:yes stop_codon:yes gene_type:complete
MKDTRKDFSLEGEANLQDDEPVGPLDAARESIEVFADNLIMQQSLREMIEWMKVLENVLIDPDISEFEVVQAKEELKIMQQAWCVIADSLYDKGISA